MGGASTQRWLVTKSPVGLAGAAEVVGVFTTRPSAKAQCKAPGTYHVYELEQDRAYRSGTLLNVEVVVIMDHRELTQARWPG